MAGVLREASIDLVVAVLPDVPTYDAVVSLLTGQCTPAEGDVPVGVIEATTDGVLLLVGTHWFMDVEYLTRADVRRLGGSPDPRGDPVGIAAFACEVGGEPGFELFNCLVRQLFQP